MYIVVFLSVSNQSDLYGGAAACSGEKVKKAVAVISPEVCPVLRIWAQPQKGFSGPP